MTRIYLAFSPSSDARKTLPEMVDDPVGINLLVSFCYLGLYRGVADRIIKHPLTILDSGAFSAWNSGKVIDIDALITETKNPHWKESITLDVIGDADASMRNALYMKTCGSPAYPVFHIGDPWEHIQEYKRVFPKVGLSCRFGEPVKESLKWLDRCFAVAWPYRFHSFGWVQESMLTRYPFHSADTASWNNRPAAFGQWKAFGKMSVRGQKSLQAEIDWYRRLQQRLEGLWSRHLAKLPV